MTVSFLALTDTDEIRATIGVDTTDLEDSIICDRNPQEDLESDLLEWVPTYQTLIDEGLASSPTTEQRQKYLKLKLYSKYFLSTLVSSAGRNSILQKQSDGSNEAVRFNNVSLNDLIDDLSKMADKLKEELKLLVDPDLSQSYSHFGIATPNYDPVTNE